MITKYYRRWNIFFLFTLLCLILFSYWPSLCDRFYLGLVYPYIRSFFDLLSSPLQSSISLVFIGFCLFIISDLLIRKKIKGFIYFLLILLSAFYWSWGFNYYSTPLKDKLGLEFTDISEEERWLVTLECIKECSALSKKIHKTNVQSGIIASNANNWAKDWGFSESNEGILVPIKPNSAFLRISILGMYFPYTGQAQYDDELPLIDKTFTQSHEFFHACGVAKEFEADFMAYLACVNSDDVLMQYSGHMHLLAELLSFYRFTDHEKHASIKALFSDEMKMHIEERKKTYEKYRGPFKEISNEMIENYLKFHGQGGISDYHRLSEFVFAYNKKMKK